MSGLAHTVGVQYGHEHLALLGLAYVVAIGIVPALAF
jgi:hypothetical protein